ILVIDPYLSDHLTRKYEGTGKPHVRMTACPISSGLLAEVGVDLILSSHKHSDHMDPGTLPELMKGSKRSVLVCPASLVDHAVSLGLPSDRVRPIEPGERFECAGFHVRAIPSAHEGIDTDASGRHLYLGFVVETPRLRLYHSGDSMRYEALTAWLGSDPFDVFFLPINGRDPARGVAGNMSIDDALTLASQCRPRYLVPHHYDMFTFNTARVSDFEQAASGLPEGVEARVLTCGERWEVRP
ncbi:MAG TPA: MBL fold metallo-hydrolase, partial [Isosphaeraceae bacterium]|nr:MBL fold metallo-hydrolase [Isosphaeraceae bacterium]